MFALKVHKSEFYRVRRGQSRDEICSVLGTPVPSELYAGRIISVNGGYKPYRASAGESYSSIAAKFAIDADELRRINYDVPVYPTAKIFVPSDVD